MTDPLLTRQQSAAALTERGYPISRFTLATLASRGGGPVFRKFSSRALYRLSDLLAWAEARCSKPMRSTSEADARGKAA